MQRRFLLSKMERMVDGKHRFCMMVLLSVFNSVSLRGDSSGCSPAPTNKRRLVEKSIDARLCVCVCVCVD